MDGPVTPGSYLGFLDWPHRPILVFSAHFIITRAHPGSTSRSVTHRQIAPGQACLTWSSFQMSFRKKGIPCWYEYPINPIKPWAKISHTHPLRRPTSSSVKPSPGTSPLGHVHASSADPCATTGHMSAHLTCTRPCYCKGRLWYQM
jgi:hypothetical protein